MAGDFNPYHVWLSIRPEEQPPNHYRLLGLPLFEGNGDVIESAADRQMAHLRTFQSGKHGELTQRLLNEVAAAKVCLFDPQKRAAYDQRLRAKLSAATPNTAASAPAVGGSAIQRQLPRRPAGTAPAGSAPSVPRSAAPSQPVDPWSDLLGNPTVKSSTGAGGKGAKSGAAERGANHRNLLIGIAAVVALVAAVGIGLFLLNGSSADGTLVFDWPPADRADTTVAVDDVSLTVPASGLWEYRCPAGSHHIVAEHLAFKIDANVAVVAGQQQTVPADWKAKAVLVLNWPLAQRSGAELKIDGRTQPISQREPLEVPVVPGKHTVQITRSGAAPLVATATVAADGRELVSIAPPPPATAKLVFDWPADQRHDSELTIDGRSQTVATGSGSGPVELTLNPGRHVVHATRAGFEPFDQTTDLAAGSNQSIKLSWTPARKTAPAIAETITETPVPVKATPDPSPEPAKKLAVPAVAEQERIAKQLDDLYQTSLPGPKDPAKAQELYDVAATAGTSPAERYMLLMKGAEIAVAAGDLKLSLQGIDTLSADYEINTLEAKQKLLDKFVAVGKADQVAAAIDMAEQLIDQAVATDQYELALTLATTASHAAIKAKVANRKEVEDRLSRRRRDIHLLQPIFASAKNAQETLDKNPADAEANLNVGRWRALYKGDWDGGLPLLSKGSDEKLKSLASDELKAPTEADQQVQLAEGWWDLAQKEAGAARDSLHLHAAEIYQAALPNLASTLKKAAIEKRLAEIADLKVGAATTGANNSVTANDASGANKPAGKAVAHRPIKPLRLAEKTQLERKRKDILATLNDEKDTGRRTALRIEAARIALQLGDTETGVAEIEDFVKSDGGEDYGNPGANALMALANYWRDAGDWPSAESCYLRVIKSYRGSYGDKGCEAASAMGAHYEAARNADKVIECKKLVVDCGGSYGGPAGDACLWLSDYYAQKRDMDRAVDYLKQVIDKYHGPFDQCKAKAEAKLKALTGK